MILTWMCKFCMWANDNNNGPCHRCGGHTEMKLIKGKWKEVTIKHPTKESWSAQTKEKPQVTDAEREGKKHAD